MNTTQLTQLRARHAVLIDKKFLEGLTPQEANELAEINRVIDDAEAKYYMNTIQVSQSSQITGNPTELEKQMYEALVMIVDELRFPFEVTKGGLTLIRLSPEQVSQVETVFQLFTVIHGLELRRGKYVEATKERER